MPYSSTPRTASLGITREFCIKLSITVAAPPPSLPAPRKSGPSRSKYQIVCYVASPLRLFTLIPVPAFMIYCTYNKTAYRRTGRNHDGHIGFIERAITKTRTREETARHTLTALMWDMTKKNTAHFVRQYV